MIIEFLSTLAFGDVRGDPGVRPGTVKVGYAKMPPQVFTTAHMMESATGEVERAHNVAVTYHQNLVTLSNANFIHKFLLLFLMEMRVKCGDPLEMRRELRR